MSKLRAVLCSPCGRLTAVELAGEAVSAGCGAIGLVDGPEVCGEVLTEIRALGVEIECLRCSEPLGSESLWGLVSRAGELGIGHVLVPAGPAEQTYSQAYDQLYSLLYEIAPEADELGVKLLIDAPQRAFLLSPLEVRGLIDAVNSPNVGVCLSFEHCQEHELGWIEVLNARLFAGWVNSVSDMTGEVLAVWTELAGKPFCLTSEGEIATELSQVN